MTQHQNQFRILLETIFQEELEAVLKSKEYKPEYYKRDKKLRKKIEKNQELVAQYAADYYINTYGSILSKDLTFLDAALSKSIIAVIPLVK